MKIDVKPDWWKTLFDDVYLMTDARSVCDEEITRREVDAVCTLLAMAKADAILDLCGGRAATVSNWPDVVMVIVPCSITPAC